MWLEEKREWQDTTTDFYTLNHKARTNQTEHNQQEQTTKSIQQTHSKSYTFIREKKN